MHFLIFRILVMQKSGYVLGTISGFRMRKDKKLQKDNYFLILDLLLKDILLALTLDHIQIGAKIKS